MNARLCSRSGPLNRYYPDIVRHDGGCVAYHVGCIRNSTTLVAARTYALQYDDLLFKAALHIKRVELASRKYRVHRSHPHTHAQELFLEHVRIQLMNKNQARFKIKPCIIRDALHTHTHTHTHTQHTCTRCTLAQNQTFVHCTQTHTNTHTHTTTFTHTHTQILVQACSQITDLTWPCSQHAWANVRARSAWRTSVIRCAANWRRPQRHVHS
jgi:hypothetical protein